MFSNYGTAMGTLFKGILMLAACSGCYLVWWGVAFYPERHVPLWLSAILLVATAACWIMAVNWMAQGIFQAEKVRAGIPGGWILAGGVIGYVVLLVISNIIFHRMVTTELFLIIGWAFSLDFYTLCMNLKWLFRIWCHDHSAINDHSCSNI